MDKSSVKSPSFGQKVTDTKTGTRGSLRYVEATDDGSPRKRPSKSVTFHKTDEVIQYTAPTPDTTEDNWDGLSLDSCDSDFDVRPLPALPIMGQESKVNLKSKVLLSYDEFRRKQNDILKKSESSAFSACEDRLLSHPKYQAKLGRPLTDKDDDFDFGSETQPGTAQFSSHQLEGSPASESNSDLDARVQSVPSLEYKSSLHIDRPSMDVRMNTIMNSGSGMTPILRGETWHRRTTSQQSDLSDGGSESVFPVRKVGKIINDDVDVEEAYWRSQADSALARQDSLQENQKNLATENISRELPKPSSEQNLAFSKRRSQILQLLDPHGAGVEQTIGFRTIHEEEEEDDDAKDETKSQIKIARRQLHVGNYKKLEGLSLDVDKSTADTDNALHTKQFSAKIESSEIFEEFAIPEPENLYHGDDRKEEDQHTSRENPAMIGDDDCMSCVDQDKNNVKLEQNMDSSLSDVSDLDIPLVNSGSHTTNNSYNELGRNESTMNIPNDLETPSFLNVAESSRITYDNSTEENQLGDLCEKTLPPLVNVVASLIQSTQRNRMLPKSPSKMHSNNIESTNYSQEPKNTIQPTPSDQIYLDNQQIASPKENIDFSLNENTLDIDIDMLKTPEIPAQSPERLKILKVKRQVDHKKNSLEQKSVVTPLAVHKSKGKSTTSTDIQQILIENGNPSDSQDNEIKTCIEHINPEVLDFIVQNDETVMQYTSEKEKTSSSNLPDVSAFSSFSIPNMSPLSLSISPFMSSHSDDELGSVLVDDKAQQTALEVEMCESVPLHDHNISLQESAILRDMSLNNEALSHLRRKSLVALYENDDTNEHIINSEDVDADSVTELSKKEEICDLSPNELSQLPADVSIKELNLGEDMAVTMGSVLNSQFPSDNDANFDSETFRSNYILRENNSYVIAKSPKRKRISQSKAYEVFNDSDDRSATFGSQNLSLQNGASVTSLSSSLPRAPSAISSYNLGSSINSRLNSVHGIPHLRDHYLPSIPEPVENNESGDNRQAEYPIKATAIDPSTISKAVLVENMFDVTKIPRFQGNRIIGGLSVREVPIKEITIEESASQSKNLPIQNPRSRASVILNQTPKKEFQESLIPAGLCGEGQHNPSSMFNSNHQTPMGENDSITNPTKQRSLSYSVSPGVSISKNLEKENISPTGLLFLKINRLKILETLQSDILVTLTIDNGVHCISSNSIPINEISAFNKEYKIGFMPSSEQQSVIATMRLSRKSNSPPNGSLYNSPNSLSHTLEIGSDGCYAQFDLNPLSKTALGKRREFDLYGRNTWAKRRPVVSTMHICALYVPCLSPSEKMPQSLDIASETITEARRLYQNKHPRAAGSLRQFGGDIQKSKGKLRYCVLDPTSPLLVIHSQNSRKARALVNLAKATDVVSIGETCFEIKFRNKCSMAFKAIDPQQCQMWTSQLQNVCGSSEGIRPKWIDAVLYES